ncbi:AI-2E family transporter [Candidatus Dependentiae bacterium]|nr:AI-2E family transporter [Candidatus Dependentiae bacterium]
MVNVNLLYKSTLLLLLGTLGTIILVYASSFLIPLAFGALFALFTQPLNQFLEHKGFSKTIVSCIAVLTISFAFIALGASIAHQIISFSSPKNQLRVKLEKKLDQIQHIIESKLAISPTGQTEYIKARAKSFIESSGNIVIQMISSTTGGLMSFFLIFVYLFLFVYYKSHLYKFLLYSTQPSHHARLETILVQAEHVTARYLWGMTVVALILTCITFIELFFIGIPYAFLWAVLAGLLNCVPYIGILISFALPAITALVTDDSLSSFILVAACFSFNQFLEGNILRPSIVGSQLHTNALASLTAVVAGGLIWGVPGLILFMPLLGIVKVICDNYESLKPIGYLIGREK